jgi:hypothetical protein
LALSPWGRTYEHEADCRYFDADWTVGTGSPRRHPGGDPRVAWGALALPAAVAAPKEKSSSGRSSRRPAADRADRVGDSPVDSQPVSGRAHDTVRPSMSTPGESARERQERVARGFEYLPAVTSATGRPTTGPSLLHLRDEHGDDHRFHRWPRARTRRMRGDTRVCSGPRACGPERPDRAALPLARVG